MTKLRTVTEAAGILRVKEITLRQWMHRGRVGFVRLGRRTLISESELCRLILIGTVPANNQAPSLPPQVPIDFKACAANDL